MSKQDDMSPNDAWLSALKRSEEMTKNMSEKEEKMNKIKRDLKESPFDNDWGRINPLLNTIEKHLTVELNRSKNDKKD